MGSVQQGEECVHQTRDSVKDIWGPRTPYKGEWPVRVDQRTIEEPERWVQSACVLCSNGCGMDIGVKDGKIVGVRGRAVDRVNKGRLGPKGMHSWVSNAHKDRLTHPLIRKNGKLERATWDEAMNLIVEKTKDIVKRLTAHGIGFYTSGQLFLEEYYALALIGKGALSTLHMDGNTRLCTATAAASMRESFGSDGQPGSYTDIDHTDCIFITGHNIAATQSVLWTRILDRLAGPEPPKIVVIDPRDSNTAKQATVHLAPKIGTNMAVLNGIQHLMFKNGWIDEEWCAKHVMHLEILREKVSKYNPQLVEEITGIPQEKLQKAAEIIGTTRSLLSTALQGVYQSNQATASACQINNINLLRGLIGKPGSGIYQMNGQPTAQNNRETGCDGEFPGFRNHMNPKQMQEIADVWNVDFLRVPHWGQPTHIQSMLKFIEGGSIEMFWISGTNPLVSLPNLPRVRSLLTQPDLFVICQDIFMTETASIADVVLPAAQWGEKTGCYTNVDRTTHISHKAVEPPGEAKSDFEIFVDYSRRMEFKDKDGNPIMQWKTTEDAFNSWREMSRGRPCDYSGMSYAKLTGGSGIQWPCNEKYPNGKERLFDDGVFFTDHDVTQSWGSDLETGASHTEDEYRAMAPAGRAFLKAADYIPNIEMANEEYPLTLSTGRQVYHFHTRTKTGRAKALQEAAPAPFIQISEEDAKKYNVKEGEDVLVKSRRGQVQLPVRVGRIAEGQTFIPFHFGYFDMPDGRARAANELTQEKWDPVSKQPMFKSGAIKLEKIPDEEPGLLKIHAQEQQSASIKLVTETKPNASEVRPDVPRERHLEFWIGATFESIKTLQEICDTLAIRHAGDHEINSGMIVLKKLADSIRTAMNPVVTHWGENKTFGDNISNRLRDALFGHQLNGTSTYEVLVAMQGLSMYLSHLQSHFTALEPTALALWNDGFVRAVKFGESQVKRMAQWVDGQLASRSPQTLLVPARVMGKSIEQLSGEIGTGPKGPDLESVLP